MPSEILVTAPDLRIMESDTHDQFLDIVLQGSLQEQGMAGFGEVLSANQAQAIQHYLISEANALRAAQHREQPKNESTRD